MNPFNYKYIKADVIFNNIILVKNFSIIELLVLTLLIITFIISIYYILPTIYIYYKYIEEKILKKKKLSFIKQIALEKQIEEEIQKEMSSN